MGKERRPRKKPEELYDSQSQKNDEHINQEELKDEVVNEGGSDEEDPATDRAVNNGGYYDRAQAYRGDEENKYLETDQPVESVSSHKSKRKNKKAKKNSKPKAKKQNAPKDENVANRDTRPLDEIGFYRRVWRCMQPKY